jgi:hypothetical protein
LKPQPEADRNTLIRRVSFDLIGLPPTPQEVEAFVNDPAPSAYERLVDRLLASPRYGERMAVDWLDVPRYADSYGFQVDREREVWPWRDWVVRAFNDNLPFDQFVTWQLAGDLLPNRRTIRCSPPPSTDCTSRNPKGAVSRRNTASSTSPIACRRSRRLS